MESGKAVGTYWPAVMSEFSPETNSVYGTLLSFSFAGGDSVNDRMSLKARVAAEDSAANWAIMTGIYKSPDGTGRFSVGNGEAHPTMRGIYFNYGTNSEGILTARSDVKEIYATAHSNSAEFYADGKLVNAPTSSWDISESASRMVYVRSVITKTLFWFYYQNNTTGTRFSIRAMRAPGGASAIYSDYNSTLVEV